MKKKFDYNLLFIPIDEQYGFALYRVIKVDSHGKPLEEWYEIRGQNNSFIEKFENLKKAKEYFRNLINEYEIKNGFKPKR